MIKNNLGVVVAKDKVKSFFDKRVEVKVNMGRNKFVSYEGKITALYPALFTITPLTKTNGKTCFSYTDYMCGLVKIKEL